MTGHNGPAPSFPDDHEFSRTSSEPVFPLSQLVWWHDGLRERYASNKKLAPSLYVFYLVLSMMKINYVIWELLDDGDRAAREKTKSKLW